MPRGVKVTTKPCGKTVQFNKKYKTECQNGTYICVVTDESGNKYVREAQVLLVDAYQDTGEFSENLIFKQFQRLRYCTR